MSEETVETVEKDRSCKSRINAHFSDVMSTLRKFKKCGWGETKDGENFCEYGLCFDYVPKGTFNNQKRGYFRYQLSWGGPSDEFRYYCDEEREPYKIEYWFLDWFDGAHKTLGGSNFALLEEIFNFFKECGSVDHAMKECG